MKQIIMLVKRDGMSDEEVSQVRDYLKSSFKVDGIKATILFLEGYDVFDDIKIIPLGEIEVVNKVRRQAGYVYMDDCYLLFFW